MIDRVIHILGIVALLAAVSCNKEMTVGSGDPVEITFSFTDSLVVDMVTKASAPSTVINSLNQVGTINCLCCNGSGKIWKVALSGTGSTRSSGKYWPNSDNPGYTFCLSNASINDNKTVSVSNISSLDVVCGYIPNPTPKTTNSVILEHVFARIGSLTINAPSGYSFVNGWSATVVYKVPASGCYYSFSSGAFSNTTNSSSQNIYASNDIWALPGSCTITVSYQLTKDYWTSEPLQISSSGLSLIAGKINNISATLPSNQNPSKLLFEIDVESWPNSPTNYNISF